MAILGFAMDGWVASWWWWWLPDSSYIEGRRPRPPHLPAVPSYSPERKRGGEADVWSPRGPHAELTATLDKTGVKTAEGPSLHWFCKLGNVLYPVFQFKNNFVTR